ncbi:MAG: DNRLRE domain-containing protein [Candidatus Onthomorpha sp.]
MKRFLLFSILVSSCYLSMGQITVTFKPNATVGKDACVWKFDEDCIPHTQTQTNSELNFGSETTLWMKDWTWSSIGCSGGTIRSLLCFTQLNTIPDNAVILSATLRLYGSNADRNTSYPGAPSDFYSNAVTVQRITSSWNENTVTWNTQPTTTTTNQFTIPQSNAEYNWNCTISNSDLVAMVQDMVSGNNYGFMLKLETEEHYRNMVFASSDNIDSTLWPELEVTYRYCNAHFAYCVASTADLSPKYTLHSLEQGGTHQWTFGPKLISTSPDFTYTFPAKSFYSTLCHRVIKDGDTCEHCIDLCLPNLGIALSSDEEIDEEIEVKTSEVRQGKISLGDEVGQMPDRETLKALPNPTNDKWNIIFEASKKSEGIVNIYNVKGECLYSKNIHLEQGTNEFDIDCKTWQTGVYVLKITEDKNETSIRLNKQ